MRLPFGLADVSNPSMVPTLRPGDLLLLHYGARVRPGDVVVARHPWRRELLIVKRAAERRDDGWWLLGDNPYVVNDSREFGAVPDRLVVARAVLRLRPFAAGGHDGSTERGEGRVQRSPSAFARWLLSESVRPLRSRSRRLRAR